MRATLVIDTFFMKETSDDLIKCKNCQKSIPGFSYKLHAAICQGDDNSSIQLTKTGMLEDDSSTIFERPSHTVEQSLSVTEKDQEPNLLLYSIIKELAHLIKSKNPQSGNSFQILETYTNNSINFENKHWAPQAIQDYQSLLMMAIKLFKNNNVSFYFLN